MEWWLLPIKQCGGLELQVGGRYGVRISVRLGVVSLMERWEMEFVVLWK